ncbi:MAG TPA: UDP-2,3-diacylglucosamine diphosphatase [candidate division Zixibacteria bacterium]|nr:UDP-2,3-diacylglucosamine diphosphatase [candidate division Zixibacteria bacterium]
MALYIFSDAHLGANDLHKEALKLARLERLFALMREDADRVVILGDLFDFWFEYKHAIPKEHHDVLCRLRDLVLRGVRVDYVSGNHDFWMGDFFPNKIGVELHRDGFDFDYDGKKVHCLHGDGLAKKDGGYRFLKCILRNPVNIWLYRKLPPDWAIPLAKKVSGSSREYTSKRDMDFVSDYEAYAMMKLNEGFDLVAIGHLHIPTIKGIGNGVYVNTGDFIENFSYAKVVDGTTTLEYVRD